MTRTQKKNRKRRAKEKAKNKQGRKDFRTFLDERGIAYQEKTKGHYTKGKARGYVERQEIEMAEKKPLSWFVSDDSSVS